MCIICIYIACECCNRHPDRSITIKVASGILYVVYQLSDYFVPCAFYCWGESNCIVTLKSLFEAYILHILQYLYTRVSFLTLPHSHCTDRSDCQHPVLLVCNFIQHQAMKDRPQHNKDLHTSIVAALNTLLRWINAHPYLLGYKVVD